MDNPCCLDGSPFDTGINDFLDLMPSTVNVAPLLSKDAYGKSTYGANVPYRAHISTKSSYVRGPNGETIVANGTIWLATPGPILDTARVTLPDGSQPEILAVNGADDETGGTLYTRIDFG